MVENRSIYHNIYVLLKTRPKGTFFLALACFLLISLTRTENFYVNKEKLMIKNITFGTIINVPNSASLLEEIRLEIDSLNLSSKQTLILKRERSDKTFIELLLKAMKGGD